MRRAGRLESESLSHHFMSFDHGFAEIFHFGGRCGRRYSERGHCGIRERARWQLGRLRAEQAGLFFQVIEHDGFLRGGIGDDRNVSRVDADFTVG